MDNDLSALWSDPWMTFSPGISKCFYLFFWHERKALLAVRRTQLYFGRYRMERLALILLQYDLAARCPFFPDRLFFMPPKWTCPLW